MSFTDQTTPTTTDAIKVSGYATLIATAVRDVGPAVVEGEIQSVTYHPNGMVFFDISDGDATLGCKVFRRDALRLTHRPKQGDLVRVDVERPDFWVAGGRLSLIVNNVRLAGVGELLVRRQELLTRLRAAGFCDAERWRLPPSFPRVVGVVSAAGSKGMADAVEALKKRFPPVRIKTCAASVQGVYAVGQVIDALARLAAEDDVDVIVVARGGGSIFDMVAFDDERLCRAVWACPKPVVVGIGHTDDDNVVNHVTWSAPTPSKTPDLVVPSAVELAQDIALARQAIECVPTRVNRAVEQVGGEARRIDIAARLDRAIEQVDDMARRIDVAGRLARLLDDIADEDQKLDVRVERCLAAREQGVRSAGGTVAMIPSLIADPSVVAAVSARIDARSQTFFSEREHALAAQRRLLAGTAGHLAGTAADVAEQGRRIATGLRRVAAAHEQNYTRALERIRGEIATAAKARLDLEQREISAATAELKRRAEQRIADAERDLRVLVAEIDSHNPMTHGYVLAADEDGRPLRSVSALNVGQPVALQFIDGRARTTVEHIEAA